MIPRGMAAGSSPRQSLGLLLMHELSGQLRSPLAGTELQEAVRRVHDAVLQDLFWLPVGWNRWLLGYSLLHIKRSHLLLPEPCSLYKRKENPLLHRGETY